LVTIDLCVINPDSVFRHKQEIALLEQRHAEELRLAHLQKTEAEQNVLELRKRLEEHEANASHLAQRLHGIMQNQWREALSVVSVPKVTLKSSNLLHVT